LIFGVIHLNILIDGIPFIVDFFFGQEKVFYYAYLKHFLKIVIVSLLMEVTSKPINTVLVLHPRVLKVSPWG